VCDLVFKKENCTVCRNEREVSNRSDKNDRCVITVSYRIA
jgi:hypothetical protein